MTIGLVGFSNSMETLAGALRVDQFAPIWPIEDRGRPGTTRYGMGGGSIDRWAQDIRRERGPYLTSLENGFDDFPDTSGLWVQVGVSPRSDLAAVPDDLATVLDYLREAAPTVDLVLSPMHLYYDGRRDAAVRASEDAVLSVAGGVSIPPPTANQADLEGNGRGDHLSPEGELLYGQWFLDSVLPLFSNGDPAPPEDEQSALSQEVEDYARRARVLAEEIQDTTDANARWMYENHIEWLTRIGNRIGSQADHLDRLAGRL